MHDFGREQHPVGLDSASTNQQDMQKLLDARIATMLGELFLNKEVEK
jgi:hypothetical protein